MKKLDKEEDESEKMYYDLQFNYFLIIILKSLKFLILFPVTKESLVISHYFSFIFLMVKPFSFLKLIFLLYFRYI